MSLTESAERGYMGVLVGENNADTCALLKEENEERAEAKAGSLSGDFISLQNGIEVQNKKILLAAMLVLKPDDEVQIILCRDGESRRKNALLPPR